MAACFHQLNLTAIRSAFQSFQSNRYPIPKCAKFRCRSAAISNPKHSCSYNITLPPGDGIGPEVISVAKDVLSLAASLEGIEFKFQEMAVGGAAIDSVGVPLQDETLSVAKQFDAVLLGAIRGG